MGRLAEDPSGFTSLVLLAGQGRPKRPARPLLCVYKIENQRNTEV